MSDDDQVIPAPDVRTDYAADRLRTVADCLERLNAQECDAAEACEAIASALYGDEVYTSDALNDALDAAHSDRICNAVADLRTEFDDGPQVGTPHATRIVALCDAYLKLRAAVLAIKRHDAALDDAHESPTGQDYNDVLSLLGIV